MHVLYALGDLADQNGHSLLVEGAVALQETVQLSVAGELQQQVDVVLIGKEVV